MKHLITIFVAILLCSCAVDSDWVEPKNVTLYRGDTLKMYCWSNRKQVAFLPKFWKYDKFYGKMNGDCVFTADIVGRFKIGTDDISTYPANITVLPRYTQFDEPCFMPGVVKQDLIDSIGSPDKVDGENFYYNITENEYFNEVEYRFKDGRLFELYMTAINNEDYDLFMNYYGERYKYIGTWRETWEVFQDHDLTILTAVIKEEGEPVKINYTHFIE